MCGTTNPDKTIQNRTRILNTEGISQCLRATDYKNPVKIRENTKKGYAEAYPGDSVNMEQPNSKTRRGRVGIGVAQTLTTSCNQAVVLSKDEIDDFLDSEDV